MEIGLHLANSPPKGYPLSVVSIPSLIERRQPGWQGRAHHLFYTVLADGDDTNDPVVDTARAILDGHILLSRQQTQLGIYPAVDALPLSVAMSELLARNKQMPRQEPPISTRIWKTGSDLMGVQVALDPDPIWRHYGQAH